MFQDVLAIIQSRHRFAITSHIRPDGDALGSELGLMLALESLGKDASIINREPVPERFRVLPCSDRVKNHDRLEAVYDAVFVLECGSIDRTGLKGFDGQFVVNVDHHHSTQPYASLNWIDENACAVGEMVYRLVKGLNVAITPEIATNIYTAVLTDTGSFQFSSTTAETFRMAADLAECGADVAGIAQNVFYSNPITKINSMKVMLQHLQMQCGGRLVWTAITRDDMVRHNCQEEDVDGLVNYPLTIAGVDVAVFFRELEDGTFRVSLRSKNSVDVSQVAAQFGGGGHRNASGCTLAGSLESVRDRLLPKVAAELANGK